MHSISPELRLHMLGLKSLEGYPNVRRSFESWLENNEQPWTELASLCLGIAGGGPSAQVTKVLSAWIVLFLTSGMLDDYSDEDKYTSAKVALARNVGGFVALAMIAEALELVVAQPEGSDATLDLAGHVLVLGLRDASLGQAWDNAGVATLDEYERMLALKAGTLVAALTESIGVLAGTEHAVREALAQCGRELGMAVQIINDFLGVWYPTNVGKLTGGDLAQSKLTYPILFGLEGPHPYQVEFRGQWALPKEDRDPNRMVEILNTAGGREFMRALLEVRRSRAIRALEPFAAPEYVSRLGQWFDRYLRGQTSP